MFNFNKIPLEFVGTDIDESLKKTFNQEAINEITKNQDESFEKAIALTKEANVLSEEEFNELVSESKKSFGYLIKIMYASRDGIVAYNNAIDTFELQSKRFIELDQLFDERVALKNNSSSSSKVKNKL